jgi:exopolysaccharide biosynthesis polyprenyl glycosylphosphotransferase
MVPPVQPDRSPDDSIATELPTQVSGVRHSGALSSLAARPSGGEAADLHAVAPALERRRPRTSGRQEQSRPGMELQLQLVALCDMAVMLVVLLVPVFIGTNLRSMPQGLTEFLALRVTVKNLLLLVGFTLAWRMLCRVTGLYRWEIIRDWHVESVRVVLTCGLVSLLALIFPAMSVTGAFRYEGILFFWIGSTAGMLSLRALVRTLGIAPEGSGQRTALIVGTGPRAQRLWRELRFTRPPAYTVVGFVDSDDRPLVEECPGTVLGGLEQLEGILMRNAIDEVLVALPIKSRYAEIQAVLESCERVGVRAKFCAELFDPINGRAIQEDGRPALVTQPRSPEGWMLVGKRMIDLIGSSVGLIVCSPVLMLAIAAIKLTSPGPVVFSQNRYGLNRRIFRMHKLRTMVRDADALQESLEEQNEASGPVFKIRRDPRVTAVGRVLRRLSIDELPQLVNVLRGDMSLVGPRPLPMRDVHRFTEAALMRRFSVRPGLTCLWQISGRCTLGFGDWITLDLKYIDEWTFLLDLAILLKTVPAVIRGEGAS